MVCSGCGFEVPAAEPYPFRCPQASAGDNIDHVLRRHLEPVGLGTAEEIRRLFLADQENPFLRYRRLLHSHIVGSEAGLDDEMCVGWVEHLDERIAAVDGTGFRTTPFAPDDALGATMMIEPGNLWVKSETLNVAGSHKARHLMGVMLWLEMARCVFPAATELAWRLAISSCGNAALAAAVVARAAGQPLEVFVPPRADPSIVRRLTTLGATIVPCPRDDTSTAGDPCMYRFQEAIAAGALPFTCQGSENGLVIEGGKTVVWEMVSELLEKGRSLDRLFVQVGGGALGTACIQGLQEARDIGLIERMPAIHTVQSQSASPLYRAWDQLMDRILLQHHRETGRSTPHLGDDSERAQFVRDEVLPSVVRKELAYAASNRSEFMWPWEEEPHSIATGILDDETYDWLALIEGMVFSGGYPLVVSEERLADAHRRVRDSTSISADATGTSGVAGLLELQDNKPIHESETVAVLVTGVER
jgi:threonine synthase